MIRSIPLCALFLLVPGFLFAADPPKPTRQVLYKTVGDVKLHLHVFEPAGHKPSDRRPAIVFFFGGGWRSGNPRQFYPQSAHLAKRGMVAMSAEYRVKSRHGVKPYACVEDGKSAIRYVRSHADKLGIDPERIAAGGGSAGGQVAAATAVCKSFDAPGEDTSVSARPNALVLFNPAYDNGPKGAGYELVKERWREFSPMHNIKKGMPPAIVFLGTKDRIIPVATAKEFQKRMRAVGSRSELMLFEGEAHGFFNQGRGDGSGYKKTLEATDKFLTSLGYLKEQAK
jgi:acetyl esterase